MMLLIGMKISFTKKPTNPITTKPIAVRTATLENSKIQKCIGKSGSTAQRFESKWNGRRRIGNQGFTFAIGFVAALHEPHAVLCEFSQRIEHRINGVHSLSPSLFPSLDLRIEMGVDFLLKEFYFYMHEDFYLKSQNVC